MVVLGSHIRESFTRIRELFTRTDIADCTGCIQADPLGGYNAHSITFALLAAWREIAFYLYAIGLPQKSWAYNSDNVWLPMPRDRQLILRAEGEPFFGDWRGEVRIAGYR
jgi:hypothetical protein